MAQQRTVSVKVSLLASDYFLGLKKMREETSKTATSAERDMARMKAGFTTLGTGLAATSVVFTGAFVAMVKASADFEQRMSQVQALSKATSSQMVKLRDAAFTAGKAFGLSATQVADAQIELTKAGVSVKDIIGGALPGALALAAAGQIDVSKATEIASNAMTEFKLNGKDVPHVADLLAAGADKSVASVESLGDALNQSGLVASQFGLSVEDTVGTLTAFSKAGLNGSDAGTSFKTMLLSLASPSKQAAAVLREYNIAAYDQQGRFVGITGLAEQLHDKLGSLSQAQRNAALSTVFGTDAIRSASVLYELGGKKLQGFIDANNEAGFAALQTSKKLDNLNGDVQKLGAAFQNDLIRSGSGANDVLRGLTRGVTGLLEVVSDIPAPLLGAGAALTAAGAGVSLLGAGALLGVPKLAQFENTMVSAGLKITPFSSSLKVGQAALTGFRGAASAATEALGGPWGLALAAAGAGVVIYDQAVQNASASTDVLTAAASRGAAGLDALLAAAAKGTNVSTAVSSAISDWSTFGTIESTVSKDLKQNLDEIAHNDSFGPLGSALNLFIPQAKGTQEALGRVGTALSNIAASDAPRAAQAFEALIQQYHLTAAEQRVLLAQMPDYAKALEGAATSAGVLTGKESDAQRVKKLLAFASREASGAATDAAASEASAATQMDQVAGAASSAATDVKQLTDALRGLGSTQLDANAAQRDFQAAVDDATSAVTKNGRTAIEHGRALDISTEKGRTNAAALDKIASTAASAASALEANGASERDVTAAVIAGRSQLIKHAIQMGLTRDAAKKYADQLHLIPSDVKTLIGLSGISAAEASLRAYKALVNGVPRYLRTQVSLDAISSPVFNGTGPLKGKATGGSIEGPGPKGKDSVLAYLAPGEHVLTAKDVDRMGGQAAVYAFRAGLDAYAVGGAVGDAQREIARDRAKVTAAQRAYNRAGKKTKSDRKQDLDDAKQALKDAQAKLTALRNDREDFVSTQRRATTANPIDPLSYVDQLRSMSRDTDFSQKRRSAYDAAANKYEKSLVTLATKSAAAAAKLDDLKSSADSMRSSVTSAITGGYQLSGVGSTSTPSGSFQRNGIRFTSYSSGISASGIDAYYRQGASDTTSFAAHLKQLAKRGVAPALLAELAGYGVAQGAPIAKALLAGTASQISSINASYGTIQNAASTAAGTVTDANYAAQIAAAQKNADQITAQIAADGEKLRKLIAQAFGLTGYAIGTMSATPGWHLVGEKGPELLRFAGGEQVANAARTQSMIAAARSGSGGATVVRMPDTITIRDARGFVATMETVADQRIAVDAAQDYILEYGGRA